LNLPRRINFATGGNIIYIYNAQGIKLQKSVSHPNDTQAITRYRGGYQYDNQTLQFVHTAEGYAKHTANPSNPSAYGAFDYVYNYTDHLGNIRLSYVLDPSGEGLKVMEENHYYPFGLKHSYNLNIRTIKYPDDLVIGEINPVLDPHPRRTRMVSNNGYQYKYNGVEFQDELGLNIYATNFRQYDPAIGRFTSIDVMAEGDADLTPYRFGYNNPVLFSDPTGLWEEVDGGHKTSDKDEIQRIYAFLQNNQNATMNQITSFVKEDIAFMNQYNQGHQLTGIEVKNGKVNQATMLRTQNEIAFYQHKTNYLYNSADIRKRNLILDGKNDPISTELLRRESNGQFLPIDASNGIKYRGGHDSAMLMNFASTFENMSVVSDGTSTINSLKNINRSSKLTYTNLGSIKARILTRLQVTNLSEAQISQFKNMSFSEFHKNYSKFYTGYSGRGTYMTVMSRDFKYLKQL
jgi:RHS repeat-associated protein